MRLILGIIHRIQAIVCCRKIILCKTKAGFAKTIQHVINKLFLNIYYRKNHLKQMADSE